MKYIDADKLKAEIDKRYAEYREKMKTDDFTYYEGMADALDLFEQFLDTLEEEPDKDLEEAAEEYRQGEVDTGCDYIDDTDGDSLYHSACLADAFKAGAKWQEKRWENNRLMAQDHATEEECQREMDFVDNHIKKHHRIPTFSDAINYGIKWQKAKMMDEWLKDRDGCFWDGVNEGKKAMKEQMMKDAVEGRVISNDGISFPVSNEIHRLKLIEGDKVKIIILPKEDGE